MYKRANYSQQHASVSPQPQVDATTLQLQSLGMRIRKAVSDGYSVSNANHNYMNEYQQQQAAQVQRTPLPSHISQPPSLSYGMSSTLEGESFENRFMMQQPQQKPSQLIGGQKRIRDDEDDAQVGERVKINDNNVVEQNKEAPIEYFQQKYGSLSFNEDF